MCNTPRACSHSHLCLSQLQQALFLNASARPDAHLAPVQFEVSLHVTSGSGAFWMWHLSEADLTVQCGLHHCSSEVGRVPFGSGWRQEEVEGLRPVVDSLEMWIVPARFQDTVSIGHWQLAVW